MTQGHKPVEEIQDAQAQNYGTYFAGWRDPGCRQSERGRLPIRRLDRAVSHSCWFRDSPCDVRRNLRSADWPTNLRSMVGVLAEGSEESDGGPPECGDEVCRNPQAGEPGMGSVRGRWTGPRA